MKGVIEYLKEYIESYDVQIRDFNVTQVQNHYSLKYSASITELTETSSVMPLDIFNVAEVTSKNNLLHVYVPKMHYPAWEDPKSLMNIDEYSQLISQQLKASQLRHSNIKRNSQFHPNDNCNHASLEYRVDVPRLTKAQYVIPREVFPVSGIQVLGDSLYVTVLIERFEEVSLVHV